MNTYMNLKIFIDDYDLKQEYIKQAKQKNLTINNQFNDAGFDLLSPSDYCLYKHSLHKLDFKIQCSAQIVLDNDQSFATGFYIYPRSSLSKTKLRLANAVGIIDSGYRGNLIGMFDVLEDTTILKNDRLLQICSPQLYPIFIEIVDNEEDLGVKTERGNKGFGSSGR